MAALVDLRQQEVGMQTHPGLSYYPTLAPTCQIMFPPDSACDRTTVHLSRYIVPQCEMIVSLAEELARSREALASLSNVQSPPPPPSSPIPAPAPPTSVSLTLQTPTVPVVTRRETTEEWSTLVATPAAPILSQHSPPPPPEGELSRKHRLVGPSSHSTIHVVSSGSEDSSDDADDRKRPLL